MRYGTCVKVLKPETVAVAAHAGFDFVECSFRDLVKAKERDVNRFLKALEKENISCEAANCLLPADLQLFHHFDGQFLADFLTEGFERAVRAGVKLAVLGSGKTRAIPDGADRLLCTEQFVSIVKNIILPAANRANVSVVLEPLGRDETNFINTLAEADLVASEVADDRFSCLADLFHMTNVGDSAEDLRVMKGRVGHGHIACPCTADGKKRCYPSFDRPWDYAAFIRALKEAGCQTCTVEAYGLDYEKENSAAAKLLKSL